MRGALGLFFGLKMLCLEEDEEELVVEDVVVVEVVEEEGLILGLFLTSFFDRTSSKSKEFIS